ncbi:pyridoxamine 5'-phosphate oxidase family protein [Streptomyces sp. NPDC006879]|uniref:pyridoxamine 5'-phosphate oxidase family protein n=1 Tax=Streptomyces sp. NPDC006879 TaxID=3364767 RepID=UPI0036949C8D
MTELSGAEALWLLGGTTEGRLVYLRGAHAQVRPGLHTLEHGLLVVRAPVQRAVVGRETLTYHADKPATAESEGWSVSAHGPAEVVDDPDEAAHYRRTLPGWAHGPHDTLVRIRPQNVSGFRLTRPRLGAHR